MPNTKDISLGTRIRAQVYGPSKAGKTYGAGTFPRPNFIVCDPDGINTLAGADFRRKFPGREIMYEEFRETQRNKRGVVTAHTAFDRACDYFDACMNPKGAKWTNSHGVVEEVHPDMFDTWVIDSGTTLSEVAMNKAIVLLGGKGMGIASQTHTQALNSGLVYPKMQDYGSERSMVEQFVQMVLDTDKHVLFLCHEKEVSNDSGSVTAIVPLLTGKGVQAVGLKFSEIWNLRPTKSGANIERKLLTQSDGIRMAGTRLGIANGTLFEYDAIVAQLTTTQSNA